MQCVLYFMCILYVMNWLISITTTPPAPPPTTSLYTLHFLSCFDRIMRAKRNGDMSRLRPPEQSKREVSGCVPTLHLYHPTHTHGIMPLHSALTMLRIVMSCVTHTLAHILTSVCAAIYNETCYTHYQQRVALLYMSTTYFSYLQFRSTSR